MARQRQQLVAVSDTVSLTFQGAALHCYFYSHVQYTIFQLEVCTLSAAPWWCGVRWQRHEWRALCCWRCDDEDYGIAGKVMQGLAWLLGGEGRSPDAM